MATSSSRIDVRRVRERERSTGGGDGDGGTGEGGAELRSVAEEQREERRVPRVFGASGAVSGGREERR